MASASFTATLWSAVEEEIKGVRAAERSKLDALEEERRKKQTLQVVTPNHHSHAHLAALCGSPRGPRHHAVLWGDLFFTLFALCCNP
jgi:hypothetical protein